MKKLTAIIFLLSLISFAHAENWVPIARFPDGALFSLDTDSISSTDLKIWSATVFLLFPKSGYAFSTVLVACEKKAIATISTEKYDDSGNIIMRKIKPSPKYQKIKPRTGGVAIYNAVCK